MGLGQRRWAWGKGIGPGVKALGLGQLRTCWSDDGGALTLDVAFEGDASLGDLRHQAEGGDGAHLLRLR